MSKFLKPSYYEGRALEQQWVNSIFTTHDLICGCLKPIEHLNCIINAQKCHPTDTTTTTGENHTLEQNSADDAIDEGDLEDLFKELEDTDG